MIGHESPAEIAACVSVSIGIFATSLVPFFLLVEAEHLTPRRVRESAVLERTSLTVLNARDRARLAALTALLRLNSRNGDTR